MKTKILVVLAMLISLSAHAETYVVAYSRAPDGYTFTYGQAVRAMPADAGEAYVEALVKGGWRHDEATGRLFLVVKRPVVLVQAHQPNDLAAVSRAFSARARPAAVAVASGGGGMTDSEVSQRINFSNQGSRDWWRHYR